jgi:hypothetical protein
VLVEILLPIHYHSSCNEEELHSLALGESCTSLPLLLLAVSAASEKNPIGFLSFFFFFVF